ncbi:MAG: hypothetical protein M1321_02790, partial [Candidatus Marsarchaeota archaeon]|nr:hypothetical protein [Candidatus Marsarchaeota archaeon]
RISALDKEIATVDAKRLQDPVEAARLVHNSEELIAKLKKDAAKSHDTLQSLQARLGSLQREVSDTGKRIKERDELLARAKGKDPEQMKKAIDECAKEIEAVDRDYAHANMLKHDAEKSFAELEKHTAKCPVCDSLLTKEKRESLMSSRKAVAEESSASMARLFKLRLEKRAMMDKLNSERNDIEVVLKSLEKYSGIEEQHRAALSMSDTVSREQSAAKALYDQANARLSEENENLSRLRIARETSERMRKHMSERDKFSEMLHAKSQELSGITVDDAAVEMLQLRHTRLMSELARQNAIMESSRKARNEKEEQARDTRGELSRASAILEELRAKKASIGDISRFKNALADTQSLLRARLVSSINETMHAIWPELYPYGDYTGAMLAASDSDYELRLRAVRDGEPVWESANAIASGGERSIACMAMRIAFSLVLVPNLRWLILDEPTHNIDSQGLSRFVSVLNEVLPSMVEQVFVITHDEQLKQVPNGRIYVLSRDKSEHEPASVSEL